METKPLTLPINEIKVIDRQRIDLGDVESLSESIQRCGQIQPIVIRREDNRLIDGRRRLAAITALGWPTIEVVYKDSLSEDRLQELELEADIKRKDRTWQEKCIAIEKIHKLKAKAAAADSLIWTQRNTAELLGVDSVREINHALKMARYLESELDENKKAKEGAKYWPCESISEAFRLYFREAENEMLAYSAKLAQENAVSQTTFEEEQVELAEFESIEACPDALAEERERYYSNPHNPPDSFEDYWKTKQEWAKQTKETIYLSKKLIHGDSIKFMWDNPGRFDHVITDIPYGIDLEMISQSKNEFRDIDTVEELHDVEYNKQLIADFFPAAFNTIKERGFCITWCDQMLFQYMYDLAIKAGFAVQRWPITWVKNTAMNSCIAYNTTKDTEIAIVCRKKKTTAAMTKNTSVVHSGKDELCNEIDHPFAKPFECWRFLTEFASLESHTILEPFAGRGSGVISMLQQGRNVTGVELDETHYNALIDNVKRLHYLKLNPNYIFK